jgi:hypothetical protein
MVFLNRGIELAHRPREPSRRETGKIIPEELARTTGQAPRDEREEYCQPTQGS